MGPYYRGARSIIEPVPEIRIEHEMALLQAARSKGQGQADKT